MGCIDLAGVLAVILFMPCYFRKFSSDRIDKAMSFCVVLALDRQHEKHADGAGSASGCEEDRDFIGSSRKPDLRLKGLQQGYCLGKRK